MSKLAGSAAETPSGAATLQPSKQQCVKQTEHSIGKKRLAVAGELPLRVYAVQYQSEMKPSEA
jgi:hypothetical protein